MNRFQKIFCFSLVCLCCGLPILATAQAKYLNLQDCLQIGLANNLQFKVEQLRIAGTEKAKRSKVSRFLPQIAGYAAHNYYFGSTIDPASNARVESNIQSDNFSIEGAINLFNFSELWESKIQASDYQIALQNKALVEREYSLNLIKQYFEALAAQEWKTVIQDQLKNSEEQFDRIQQEVADGAKPESDLYDMQVVFTQEKKLLQQTMQDEENQKLALLQLMNDSSMTIHTLILAAEQQFITAVSNQVISQQPAIRLEEVKALKMQQEYQQLLGPMLPKLGLSYTYGTFYSNKIKDFFDTSLQFGNQLSNNKNQFVGLNLAVPIFSRGDRQRQRTVKKIQLQEQEITIEKTKLDLQQKVQMEHQKVRQFEELHPILLEHLDYANKALTATQDKFHFGKVDISAYKVAKNQVLNANYDVLKNKLFRSMSFKLLETMYQD